MKKSKIDSRMWRKAAAVFLSVSMLCAVTSACGMKKENESFPITMQEMIEAGRTENILKSCSSFSCDVEFEKTEKKQLSYGDKELYYFDYQDMQELYLNGTCDYMLQGDLPGAFLYIDTEPQDDSFFKNVFYSEEVSAKEVITNSKKDGDKVYVETKMSPEDAATVFQMEQYEYKEGDYLTCSYTLDAATYRQLVCEGTLHGADGSSSRFSKGVGTYNEQRPETAEMLYQHATQTTDLRTMTIVVNPDTANEKSYSKSIPKGDAVYVVLPEGNENATYYTDRECTQVYSGGADQNRDLTLYVPLTAQ